MPESELTFPLEVILETDMPELTNAAIRQLLCQCFPADAEAFARSRAWHESAPEFSVVCREADAVVGHVGVVIRAIRCGDTPVTVAGIQNLCVTPEFRGAGLAQGLMVRALGEAMRRRVELGLLFCESGLQSYYCGLGWRTLDEPVTMLDQGGHTAPIPGKNIAMMIELTDEHFPAGPVDLAGPDW